MSSTTNNSRIFPSVKASSLNLEGRCAQPGRVGTVGRVMQLAPLVCLAVWSLGGSEQTVTDASNTYVNPVHAVQTTAELKR